MMALAAKGSIAPPRSDELLRRIRPGLLALKQFEQVYVLARWIRSFFMDILKRSESPPANDSQPSHDLIMIGGTNEGQPITPESVSYGPMAETETSIVTPISATQTEFSTTNLIVEDPSYMVASDMEGVSRSPTAVTRGMSSLWPASWVHGAFSNSHDSDLMDFPQPDSLQYQFMYFLADLGIASSECPVP